nr:LysR substrate-binding domain-containing protein [Shewanella sp. MEBiC00475]
MANGKYFINIFFNNPRCAHPPSRCLLNYAAVSSQIELVNNENLIDLLEQRTDIAIRIGELKDSTLTESPLGLSQIRILASPDYLAKHGTPATVEDLTQHQLLGFS